MIFVSFNHCVSYSTYTKLVLFTFYFLEEVGCSISFNYTSSLIFLFLSLFFSAARDNDPSPLRCTLTHLQFSTSPAGRGNAGDGSSRNPRVLNMHGKYIYEAQGRRRTKKKEKTHEIIIIKKHRTKNR